jgi:hypothetical protein
MSSEIIQSVTYDKHDDFQLLHFVFSRKIRFIILRII